MALTVAGLSGGYGRRDVLEGIDLSVQPGEVVGVLGPNGAGKSTLLKVLTRRLRVRAGRVTLDGRPLEQWSRPALARTVAVVQQGAILPPGFTVEQLVAMGRMPHQGLLRPPTERDRTAVAWAMEQTDTVRLRTRTADALSGGERQRVVLARALAQQPRYLLLDEPTTHLDLRYQVELLAAARREVARGLGAVVVLHDLNLAARTCDRLIVLADGRLVAQGTPSAVLTAGLVKRIYGDGVEVGALHGRPVVLPRWGSASGQR